MTDTRETKACMITSGGHSFLIERGLLHLDLSEVNSLELFYEDGDSFNMFYERIGSEELYQERFEDPNNDICPKCGEPIENPEDHDGCEYNIGNGEYIREVINNIISHNKDDENEIKILFTINGDRSNIFKIV